MFSHLQTLTQNSSDEIEVTDITADGKYLLEISWQAKITVYKNINNKFSFFQSIVPNDNST